MNVQLYAFHPNGHGEMSFFVMAKSEDEARQYVDNLIEFGYDNEGYSIRSRGWGTDYYTMTVYNVGEVATNENE